MEQLVTGSSQMLVTNSQVTRTRKSNTFESATAMAVKQALNVNLAGIWPPAGIASDSTYGACQSYNSIAIRPRFSPKIQSAIRSGFLMGWQGGNKRKPLASIQCHSWWVRRYSMTRACTILLQSQYRVFCTTYLSDLSRMCYQLGKRCVDKGWFGNN